MDKIVAKQQPHFESPRIALNHYTGGTSPTPQDTPTQSVARKPSSLDVWANEVTYGTSFGKSRTSTGPLLAEHVLHVAKSATKKLERDTVDPRRKVAFALAEFQKGMLRLKADLEALGKPDEDGKTYKLSQPKAIALILMFLRKWEGKEITTISGEDITFAHWKELLVDVKEKKMGANRDPILEFDVDKVLAQIVPKFVPDSLVNKFASHSLASKGDSANLSDKAALALLKTLSDQSREQAEKSGRSNAAAQETAWLEKLSTSNDKKFLEQAAINFGFGDKRSPQEAKIPASQWNAIVGRLDAEVSPWQNRLSATMQKAQHDVGLVNNFLTKMGEIIRTLHNDARVPLY